MKNGDRVIIPTGTLCVVVRDVEDADGTILTQRESDGRYVLVSAKLCTRAPLTVGALRAELEDVSDETLVRTGDDRVVATQAFHSASAVVIR